MVARLTTPRSHTLQLPLPHERQPLTEMNALMVGVTLILNDEEAIEKKSEVVVERNVTRTGGQRVPSMMTSTLPSIGVEHCTGHWTSQQLMAAL